MTVASHGMQVELVPWLLWELPWWVTVNTRVSLFLPEEEISMFFSSYVVASPKTSGEQNTHKSRCDSSCLLSQILPWKIIMERMKIGAFIRRSSLLSAKHDVEPPPFRGWSFTCTYILSEGLKKRLSKGQDTHYEAIRLESCHLLD